MKFSILSSLIALTIPALAQISELKPDPKTVFGTLDNGLQYIIRPNAEPPGRFSVRLHIAAGSLHEADDQRGIAHFLEHMVFNGTKNFTAAEIIPKMQRLGISFGAHANAYTSFDETVYMLDLPNMTDETVDLTFTVMRDFADGALLKLDEIDKERGVIISEKTSRDSVSFRMFIKQFDYLLPDSHLMKRLPIGTEEVIRSAPRERFVHFYKNFYTPERMTFIVTGDFKVEEMEKRVRDSFISLTNPATAGKNPKKDIPPTGFGFRTAVFTDKEITTDNLTLHSIRPFTRKPDTKAERLAFYPLNAAHAILSRRFDILAKKENSPILSGGGSRSTYFNMVEAGSITVSPAEDQWEKALPVMEQEFRRAFEHGFTQAEIDEISAQWMNAAEQAVKRADTRDSQGIAMSYVSAVNRKAIVLTPEDQLSLTKEGLATLTPARLHEAFKTFWDTPDLSLILVTNEAAEDTKDKLKDLYLASAKTPVTAPKNATVAAFAYHESGTPGTVTEKKQIEDLAITQLTLDNNIRVNLKKTDFEKNSISLVARFGSGTFKMPQDKPGLHQFASAVYQGGGLGKHSVDDLQRVLAGKNVGVGFQITESDLRLLGRTTPDDLELQLQLMCAHLTDPGYRAEGERQFKMQIPMIYNQIKHSMMGASLEMEKDMTGGDFRSLFPTQEALSSYSTQMVQDWLNPELKNSPIELSLVGDFDIEKATALILKTFGSLPKRTNEPRDFSALRKIQIPARPAQKKFTFESKIPNAMAIAAWSIPGAYQNEKQIRRFNLLAAILSDKLREEIREKLGGSYSPSASANPNTQLDYGYLQAVAQVKPGETKKYGELMIQLAHQIAQNGVTADELERARKPIESNLKQSKRQNSYWLQNVLSSSQSNPNALELARNREADYASITVEELSQLAATHLKKENSLLYEVVPETKE